MTDRRKVRWKRWQRDTTFVTFALSLAAVEALFLGARASTFTFCIGILLSPLVWRIDESRKGDR